LNTVQRVASFAALTLSLICFNVPALAAAPGPIVDGTLLDVPYLPQTEALCGGAAAAMLFRFWGDAHASVQQFAPLVDREEGGIADAALIDAIRKRHWSAVRLDGSLDALRTELSAGRPPMLLIEDRPQRYHYLIAVGMDATGVLLHDPTWGPARRLSFDRLQSAWAPAGFWMLRVTPDPTRPRTRSPLNAAAASSASGNANQSGARDDKSGAASERPRSVCDERLDAALDEIAARGLDGADTILEPLVAQCPRDGGPVRELAGVRFAQRRWADASGLARTALALEPGDRFAADVLGSSRFMLNDFDGALRAWNIAGRPLLDSVRIMGLTRTRYSLVAEALDLSPESMLTADAFKLARRRLQSMPDLASTRLAVRPDEDGYAVAEIAVAERATLPRSAIQWTAAAVQAALEREVAANVPGRTGQGETWTAAWGWWEHRPKISVLFAAPLISGPRGVWRVGLSWDAQTYGAESSVPVREERLQGHVGLSSWLSANIRASASAGLDSWTRPGAPIDGITTLRLAGELEQRLLTDRLALQLSLAHWFGVADAAGFGSASADLSFRSRRDPGALVAIARAGGSAATTDAPLALWSGAGEGRSRGPLLRAHTLLRGGRIDGPVFGRRLAHATLEVQHWLRRPALLRVGGALFTDAAVAGQRPAFAQGRPFQIDSGVGLRVRVPGRSGVFRVDYTRGLRDGARAWLVGWQAQE